jgi:hypothetical protein
MRYSIVIMSVFLILLVGCTDNEKEPLMQLSISPTGGNFKTYIIILDSHGNYNIRFGTRDENNESDMVEVKEHKSILLTEKDLDEIKQLIKQFDRLKNIKKSDYFVNDGLDLNIKTNKNVINIYYGEMNNYDPLIRELVEKILKLSPINLNLPRWRK